MRKDYYSFILLYSFAYGAIGVMTPLIGQYLSSIGFSGVQVGVITAVGTGVAVFAGSFWGRVYANSQKPYRIIIFLCLMAAGVGMCLYILDSFYAILIVFGAMYFFQAPIMSLNDSMTMETKHSFGLVRMWGAIGFAVAVLFAGKICDMTGMSNIFPMYAACYGTAALSVFRIIKKKTGDELRTGEAVAVMDIHENIQKKPKKKLYRDLLSNKKLICLIASTFFISGTNVANNTYFGFLYTDGGGTVAGIGLAFLLMAGSEAPFMGLCSTFSRKVGKEKLLLIAMAISVMRFAWYATGPDSMWLLILSFLQGAVNGIILVEFVHYVADLAGMKYASMGIAAYYVTSNLSTITCQLIGGAILDGPGAAGVYLFFAVFNLIGVVLYTACRLYRR